FQTLKTDYANLTETSNTSSDIKEKTNTAIDELHDKIFISDKKYEDNITNAKADMRFPLLDYNAMNSLTTDQKKKNDRFMPPVATNPSA
ncbi:MAG: hypothetical protein EBX69_09145, partial [Betaproteobacteria bacterium]|nr:hypothetical protein [Betaproteobacteria bacterium]